jgi:AcrR family transcriptional regulator
MCNNLSMARKYELRRRAERQAETRRRIVDAAVALHRTKGPARTTLSDVARAAGVQRNTLYRHFPTMWDLFLACSGQFRQEHPPPDAALWLKLPEPEARLRRGLTDLYAYYEQVEDMYANVLRDAEVHPLTWEISQLRQSEVMSAIRDALLAVVPRQARAQAALQLALDFRAWRKLARDGGLSPSQAAETMTRAILAQ